jgi:mitogen-activated protein kinase kinase kinase
MASVVLNGLGGHPSQPSSSSPSPTSPTTSVHSQSSFAPRRSSLRGSVLVVNGLIDPPAGVSYVDFLRTWSDADTARWLAENRCGHHADTFRANDIRGDLLLELDQATLKEMDIPSIGDRMRIMNAVKVLRQRCSQRAVVAPHHAAAANRPRVSVSTTLATAPVADAPHAKPSDQMISPLGRTGSRRLDGARPAPLRLNSAVDRQNLPALIRDPAPPDSARSARAHATPTPTPSAATPHTATSAVSARPIPPLPPAPRGHPPPAPPLAPPQRAPPRGLSVPSTGRSTPTPVDSPYASSPHLSMPLVQTPNTASSLAGWTGSYGLPPDPRSGGAVGRPTRPISPLANNPPRGSSRSAALAGGGAGAAHNRNSSSSSIVGAPAPKQSLPQRPSTSGSTGNQSQLSLPNPHAAHNLSPIAESFISQAPSTPTPPHPPSYAVGRGPFASRTAGSSHAPTPSLDDLRRRLIKFTLEDGNHGVTINVTDCTGGVEVLEKALKKFGKLPRVDPNGSIMDHVSTEDGGLTLDGWGAYLDWGMNVATGMARSNDILFDLLRSVSQLLP